MATKTILSNLSVSMTEFKKNPNGALRKSGGQAVAVLSHNKPAFYIVPPDRYQAMLEAIDDLHLVGVVKERLKQKGRAVEVSLDELLGGITAKNHPKWARRSAGKSGDGVDVVLQDMGVSENSSRLRKFTNVAYWIH